MLTVLVASSKGGCGKSTLATQLASHWAQAGKRTAIVDADRQHSSFRWAARRPDSVPGVLALEGGRKALGRLPGDTERVLVDTPAGVTERELEPYLESADALLVPVLPSSFDLDATLAFLGELQQVGRIKRGKLPVGLRHAVETTVQKRRRIEVYKLVGHGSTLASDTGRCGGLNRHECGPKRPRRPPGRQPPRRRSRHRLNR